MINYIINFKEDILFKELNNDRISLLYLGEFLLIFIIENIY